MKTKSFFIKLFGLTFIFALLLISCSPKIYYDDAIRIKPDSATKYNYHPETNKLRNGNTLRGEVLKIEVYAIPDSCPITDSTIYKYNSYVVFVDSTVKEDRLFERIPIEDVDLMGTKLNIKPNQYNNINLFENFNNPLLHKEIREVPVDSIYLDTCSINCPCNPLPDIFLLCALCDFNIKCPDRELQNWFLCIKPGYAFYNDIDQRNELIGREDWNLDISAGVRLGQSKRLGLGVIYSTGVKTFYNIDSSLIRRPSVNLYARYDLIRDVKKYSTVKRKNNRKNKTFSVVYDTIYTKTYDCCYDSIIVFQSIVSENPEEEYDEDIHEISINKRPCLNPFIYGLLGVTIDDLSLDLIKVSLNDECKRNIQFYLPYVDLSIPINYGFGIGIEYPLSSYMDISLDLGFRSLAYGNKYLGAGLLIPTLNRVNSIILRLGIVF